jgi:AsmA protein
MVIYFVQEVKMSRFLKIIALIFGILVVLIIVAALVLPMIIDVNDYKDRISLEIEKSTGYEVVLEGDIELSLIPWIGLSLGKTHVANPPGFDDSPMASLDELQVRVKFWPLFAGRVEADRIVLSGFELALTVDDQGRQNWAMESPDPEPVADEEKTPAEVDEPAAELSPALLDLNIEGLEVANAGISYEDRQNNQAVYIRDLNFKTGKISMDTPFDLSADMQLESLNPEIQGDFKLNAQTTLDLRNEIIRLDNFLLNISAQGEVLAAPIKDDHVGADILYEISNNALYLNNLDIRIHDAKILGNLSALNLDRTPDISFDLKGRNIDLDKISADASEGQGHAASGPEDPSTQAGSGSSQGEPMNLSFLSDFNIDGKIDIEEIKADNLKIDNLYAAVKSGQGKMTVSPLTIRLYEGVQESDITLEDIRGTLHIHAVHSLEGMQIGPFIRDLTENDIITGTATIKSDINMWGQDNEAFVRSMSGEAELSLSDGVIKGVDLERMIRQVFALAAGEIGALDENGGETDFTRMGASFDINNGIAVSRDLAMNSPVIGLKGGLTADLPRSHLDSRSQINLDGALKEELVSRYNLRDMAIPLRVRGPFDDLSFEINSEAIIKGLVQDKGEEVMRKLLDQAKPSKDRENGDESSDGVEGLLRRMIPGS